MDEPGDDRSGAGRPAADAAPRDPHGPVTEGVRIAAVEAAVAAGLTPSTTRAPEPARAVETGRPGERASDPGTARAGSPSRPQQTAAPGAPGAGAPAHARHGDAWSGDPTNPRGAPVVEDEPSGGYLLPDWSDPPTGQVPRVLLDDSAPGAGTALTQPGRGPSWRESGSDWDDDGDDLSFLAAPEVAGARDAVDPVDPFERSFAELELGRPLRPGISPRQGSPGAESPGGSPTGGADAGDEPAGWSGSEEDAAWTQLLSGRVPTDAGAPSGLSGLEPATRRRHASRPRFGLALPVLPSLPGRAAARLTGRAAGRLPGRPGGHRAAAHAAGAAAAPAAATPPSGSSRPPGGSGVDGYAAAAGGAGGAGGAGVGALAHDALAHDALAPGAPAPPGPPGPPRQSLASSTAGASAGGEPGASNAGRAGRNAWQAILTGCLSGGLALAAFLAGPLPTVVLVSVVVTLAAGEALAALRRGGLFPVAPVALAAAPALMIAAYDAGLAALPAVLAAAVVLSFGWLLAGRDHRARHAPVASLGATLLAVAWVGVLGAFAGALAAPGVFPARHGLAVLVAAVLLAVGNDVGAYAAGSRLGRHKMAPQVSPGKSWEGAAGGSVATLLLAGLVAARIHPLDLERAMLLGVVVCLLAPLGDLAESLLKRDLGLKDMGDLLPAHGGVLDRIDSLLFVLPVAYFLAVAWHLG